MLDIVPSESVMIELLGQSLFEIWQSLCSAIDDEIEHRLIHGVVGIICIKAAGRLIAALIQERAN